MCDFIFTTISDIGTHDLFMSCPSYVHNVSVLDKRSLMMTLFTNLRAPAHAKKHKKRACFFSVEIGDKA